MTNEFNSLWTQECPDEDDDHTANYMFLPVTAYYDEDVTLTHESQFAGWGKKRKQHFEKTKQNSAQSFGLRQVIYFQCRSHALNLQAHISRASAEQESRQYKVKLIV